MSSFVQVAAITLAVTAFRYNHKYQAGWLALTFALCLMLGRQITSSVMTYDSSDFYLSDALWTLPIAIFLLIGVVTVRKIVFDLNESNAKLLVLIQTDDLTGALSRTEIFRLCRAEIERCQRTGLPLAIIELDIDHFKYVNDEFGHAAGDVVLLGLTRCCMESIRIIDSFGRTGGEEFIILLPDTDVDSVQVIAERLRRNVEKCSHLISNGEHINVTISIGIAIFDPLKDIAILGDEDLLKKIIYRADSAMYLAKDKGRNRVVVW